MSFGKMNTFIDIISVETTRDSEGFGKSKDIILASVRAYKEERHGNEKWANRAVFSEATALFCFRKIPDVEVSTNTVIVCSDGRYEITNVEDVKGRGMYLSLIHISPQRMNYCKKMDSILVEKLNRKKPTTMRQIEDIWYEGYSESRGTHYHRSRYHFLNLHSFFTGNHTVELRGFNSELHAGKIRSYIVLALAINHQALTQKCASAKKPQVENEKFAMRTYLNRIGFIGDEFANCREHLTAALSGSAAWRFRAA